MKNQLTLLHFETPEDLHAGIDALQQHNIIIREIYAPAGTLNIQGKLKVKQLRFSEAIFKFGCLGGMGLASLGYCLLQPQTNWEIVVFNALLLLAPLLIADRLFSVIAPMLISLKPGDKRYLAVIDTQGISANESIAHFFQYTRAVQFSPAIKNMVIS